MDWVQRYWAVSHRRAFCRRMLAMALLLPGGALAELAVEVADMDPAASQSLFRGDALSVRLIYASDEPVRFTLQGYARGEPVVRVHSNPAPVYPAGNGEAIAWLALTEAGYLDEIRVQVADQQWQVQQVLSEPVSLFWERGSRPTPRSRPAWVDELNTAQQAMVSTAYREASTTDSALGSMLVPLMGWSIPGYLVLQIYMLLTFRGAWRKAALVPLLLMVPLTGYTIFALLAGSNLWPLMLLFLTPLAFLYLVAVAVARWSVLRRG